MLWFFRKKLKNNFNENVTKRDIFLFFWHFKRKNIKILSCELKFMVKF